MVVFALCVLMSREQVLFQKQNGYFSSLLCNLSVQYNHYGRGFKCIQFRRLFRTLQAGVLMQYNPPLQLCVQLTSFLSSSSPPLLFFRHYFWSHHVGCRGTFAPTPTRTHARTHAHKQRVNRQWPRSMMQQTLFFAQKFFGGWR